MLESKLSSHNTNLMLWAEQNDLDYYIIDYLNINKF